MSKGLRHVFSPMRISAAEGILGAVALVLVIWLLWPEGSTPKLDQRATWQQHLKQTDVRQRSDRETDRHLPRRTVAVVEPPKPQREQTSPVIERRLLAKPSELADRVKYDSLEKPVARPEGFKEPTEEAKPVKVAAKPVEAVVEAPPKAQQPAIDAKVATKPTIVNQSPAKQEAADTDPAPTPIVSAALTPDSFEIESSTSSHVSNRPRDDAPSWLRNAVALSLTDERPVIAVVIDDLGLNRPKTKALNDLPAPLTLAFLPYAGNIEAQTTAARQAGHELMVHLPMEPFGSAWPGPEALITSLSQDEFAERLRHNLDKIDGYAGVNNHMGSRLTSDRGRMDIVMRELRGRDVLFLDSKTSPRSVASEMASRNGVPNTTRDIFLDHVIDIDKIRRQMAKVEQIARQTGSAVAIGHPHDATMEALNGWLPELAKRGFVLAPISAVVARRACQNGLLIAAETCGRYLYAGKPSPPGGG